MPDDQFWWLDVKEWRFTVTGADEPVAWGYMNEDGTWVHGVGWPPPEPWTPVQPVRLTRQLFGRGSTAMQTYKSHKVVEAAEILSVVENPSQPGVIVHLKGEKENVALSSEWLGRHGSDAGLQGMVGGYLVKYPDGYMSWSPKEAFEGGYTKITLVTDGELAALAGEHILQFFTFLHLPPALQEISRPFTELAAKIMHTARNPERTVALRKLLESKDAAVRAHLAGPMPGVEPPK